MANDQEFEKMLRAASLRVTRTRIAVLNAVDARPHADANDVFDAIHQGTESASKQAVYDVLTTLVDVGLLRCIKPSGSTARYERRVGDNHHHAVCRDCGKITDVDCAIGQGPCLHASDSHGYSIDEADVIYWGICPDCTAKKLLTQSPSNTTRSK
ncbi:Fur family transcriptional regulator [Glutamicibacter sp. M10]|uniref:Fur family transcriptional regulator n=1 Tax=Glutamicibacter sp. M10 TaxID=3023076 RepID=UPI0021C9B05D|nr:Fur family transcriptional regulator [Glutamicibacter sp. M10]UXN32662.1 transcriptional repressor [Glutamicibacter sp. M10]